MTAASYIPIVPGDRVTLIKAYHKHPEVVRRNVGASGAIIRRRKDGFYDVLLDNGDTIKISTHYIRREE